MFCAPTWIPNICGYNLSVDFPLLFSILSCVGIFVSVYLCSQSYSYLFWFSRDSRMPRDKKILLPLLGIVFGFRAAFWLFILFGWSQQSIFPRLVDSPIFISTFLVIDRILFPIGKRDDNSGVSKFLLFFIALSIEIRDVMGASLRCCNPDQDIRFGLIISVVTISCFILCFFYETYEEFDFSSTKAFDWTLLAISYVSLLAVPFKDYYEDIQLTWIIFEFVNECIIFIFYNCIFIKMSKEIQSQ